MEQSPYPVVRLNPKGDARAIRRVAHGVARGGGRWGQ